VARAASGPYREKAGVCVKTGSSEFQPRLAENLVRPKLRVEPHVVRRRRVGQEVDAAAAANAAPEDAQAVGGGRPVPDEAASFAARERLGLLVQRAANVPSRCSSAFEIFCAAGKEELVVRPGACAYG
jgi:hypothetical protein